MTSRPDWIHTTNIYEVNLRQYSEEGSFNAFAQHLDRLKEMGIHTLWFMPLTPIAQKNKKGSLGSYYACSDYTSVNPEFGTVEDFRNLVIKAHALGFKVIIDWVANHTGWDHIWAREYPEYYIMDPITRDFKMASGMEDIIELDHTKPALRKAMIEAMKFWVQQFDIDGFRCDLAFWVTLDFWKAAREELDTIKPLFWLGEFDELDHPQYSEVFHASYSWTWMHQTEVFYKKDIPLDSLYTVLKRYDDLGDSTLRTWFTSNHDENSWNGTEYEKYGEMAMALAVFSATWNGIPLLYSGQELPNKKRLQFFDKDPIGWTGEYELEDFYRRLLELHSTHPVLRGGDATVQTFRVKTNDKEHVFAYLRKRGDKEILVLLNLSKESSPDIEILDDMIKGVYKNCFTGIELAGEKRFEMRAWEYLVFEKV